MITVNTKQINLALLGKFVFPRPTLPILNNVLIDVEPGWVTFSTSKLDAAASVRLPVTTDEKWRTTVTLKTLKNAVDKSKTVNLSFDNLLLTVNYATLRTLPAEEFPVLSRPEPAKVFNPDPAVLRDTLQHVVFATTRDEACPVLTSVCLSLADGIRAVATDWFVCVMRDLQEKRDKDNELLVPRSTVLALIAALKDVERVRVNITPGHAYPAVFILDDNTIIRTALVDGSFPDVRFVIPKKINAKFVLETAPALALFEKAAKLNPDTAYIRFKDEELLVLAKADEGSFQDKIKITGNSEFICGVRPTNFVDFLKTIHATVVELSVTEPNTPLWFNAGLVSCLIMPVHIEDKRAEEVKSL